MAGAAPALIRSGRVHLTAPARPPWAADRALTLAGSCCRVGTSAPPTSRTYRTWPRSIPCTATTRSLPPRRPCIPVCPRPRPVPCALRPAPWRSTCRAPGRHEQRGERQGVATEGRADRSLGSPGGASAAPGGQRRGRDWPPRPKRTRSARKPTSPIGYLSRIAPPLTTPCPPLASSPTHQLGASSEHPGLVVIAHSYWNADTFQCTARGSNRALST